jgi:carboxymethylenebutenolidase
MEKDSARAPEGLWTNDHFNSLVPETEVNRRSFVAACIAAGFAVTANPVLGQAIKTPDTGLETGDVKIGDIPAYYAVKKGTGKRPVVLLVGEIWGLHEYTRDMVRRLARDGYFAVANEPYFRIGELWREADIKKVLAGANSLTDQQAFADLDAVVAWAEKHPRANAAKLGITGHCRGGRMVYMYTAHQKKIDAGVAWYGGLGTTPAQPLTPIDVTDKINKPVLGLYAGDDSGIPMAMIDRLKAGFRAFEKEKLAPIHVYPGMPHGFHADYRPSYRKAEAEDAWKRMNAWFKKNGVA